MRFLLNGRAGLAISAERRVCTLLYVAVMATHTRSRAVLAGAEDWAAAPIDCDRTRAQKDPEISIKPLFRAIYCCDQVTAFTVVHSRFYGPLKRRDDNTVYTER